MKCFYKRIKSYGPGGVKCSCCFPPGGSTTRKDAKREAGKSARRFFTKLLNEEICQ